MKCERCQIFDKLEAGNKLENFLSWKKKKAENSPSKNTNIIGGDDMLYIEKNSSQHIIHLIKKLKENYNLNNRQLAHELETGETQISRWLNGQAEPNKTKTQKIWDLFLRTWQPGILKLSPNSHWNCEYFVEVMDIKNPFETFVFDNDYENGFDTFLIMLQECEKLPWEIYRTYEPDFVPCIHHIVLNLNTTMCFINCFLNFETLEDAFIHYKGLNPGAFDYQLIKEKKDEKAGKTK